MPADWYLFAHGVDSVGPQQRHRLLHQVGPSTVEHPEAQVLLELGFNGHGVQLPRSTKAVVRPERGRDGHVSFFFFPPQGLVPENKLPSKLHQVPGLLFPQIAWSRLPLKQLPPGGS